MDLPATHLRSTASLRSAQKFVPASRSSEEETEKWNGHFGKKLTAPAFCEAKTLADILLANMEQNKQHSPVVCLSHAILELHQQFVRSLLALFRTFLPQICSSRLLLLTQRSFPRATCLWRDKRVWTSAKPRGVHFMSRGQQKSKICVVPDLSSQRNWSKHCAHLPLKLFYEFFLLSNVFGKLCFLLLELLFFAQ